MTKYETWRCVFVKRNENFVFKNSGYFKMEKIRIKNSLNGYEKFFFFSFISWRLITLQYCSGFCHTLI